MPAHAQAITQRLQTKPTAWKALENHYRKVRGLHLRHLFADDLTRGETLTAHGAGIYLDYSKNRITDQTIRLLVQLAEESGLHARIDGMFRGQSINITENRPALHVALRTPRGASIFVDGENVVPGVHRVLDKMARFSNCVRSGEWKGHTGKRIRNLVNLGVGGCGLGPVMAYEALKAYSDRSLDFRFVASIDGSAFAEAIRDCDPSETLFIICAGTSPKSETMTIAKSARSWMMSAFGGNEALGNHFVAVSADLGEFADFGIGPANNFEIWKWVGESFSIDSAIGLSTMLAVGPENFRAMLDGFHKMDMHFLATPFERNLPVIMGLLVVWYVNFFNAQTMAVLPYSHYLTRFPAFVQHLMMDSNGKHITPIGTEVTQATSPVPWGEPGTNGQHSFYQMLYQGTNLIPCDFITFAKSLDPIAGHHDMLVANALAHSAALARGRSLEEIRAKGLPDWLAPHLVLEGNRPSNTIMLEQLSPSALGALIALYEHSVFTQGVIWNINSFDRWGLEFGDSLAERLTPELGDIDQPELQHDSSTNALIHRYRKLKTSSSGFA